MRITALMENTSACGLPTEHGLSLFIQKGDLRILFDMGQTDLYLKNAETLGIDLDSAAFAVLSHGHYDHGGGLKAFLAVNGHAPVYMNPYAFEPHYSGTDRYIGLDPALSGSGRIVYIGAEENIAEGITLYGRPPGPGTVQAGSSGLNTLRDGRMSGDDFRHELYLVAEEDGRRILFSGCAHRGILNIMHWYKPDVFVGGFHLSKHPLDGELEGIAQALDAYETVYYTGHCTGTEQFRFLKDRMRNLHYLSAGESIEI